MSESPSAGWFADPFGRHELRYWDGTLWTEHVASEGAQATDPPVGTPSAVSAPTVAAGWYSDPFGRYDRRYWNGSLWTEHVTSGGKQCTDPPVQQAIVPAADRGAIPPTGRVSKKAERQARAAGARDNEACGGTLFTEQVLVVNQRAKLFGSTLGYAVFSQSGQQLGMVQELRRGLTTKLSDSLMGRTAATREHRFEVVDMRNRLLLAMTRPKVGFFQIRGKLVIDGPGGAPIGQIVHESFGVGGAAATAAHTGITNASTIAQFGLGGIAGMFAGAALESVQEKLTSAVEGLDKVGHARFGLEAGGQRLGSVHAESTTQWDFSVHDPTGTEIARITKIWAGWAMERFTKADNYVVQMHKPLDEPLRSLVIATALAIDVELKQNGAQTRGSSTLGTRTYK